MDLSTSMEIGYILIAIILLLLIGGMVSVGCALFVQPKMTHQTVQHKIPENKKVDAIEDFMYEEENEIELNEDLFDD